MGQIELWMNYTMYESINFMQNFRFTIDVLTEKHAIIFPFLFSFAARLLDETDSIQM